MKLKTFSGRPASQHPDELAALVNFARAENVLRYLEIGARHGDTLHAMGMSLPEGSLCVAVDMADGPWGSPTSKDALCAAVESLRMSGRQCHAIFGDSASETIVNLVSSFKLFDLILIDGDHRYDSVKRDWMNYRDLGRHIAFHDIIGMGQMDRRRGMSVDVPRLWAEIKECGVSREFVSDGSKMGIGVLSL